MPHVEGKAHIPKALQERIDELEHSEHNGLRIVRGFAIFIDTHRDQPHIGSLYPDIHRGMCRPTAVDYIIGEDLLLEPEQTRTLQRHDKHLFLDPEWYTRWLVTYMATNGSDPRDGDGVMPTSHFRDARAKRYDLKSFRQIVVDRWLAEAAARTKRRRKKV